MSNQSDQVVASGSRTYSSRVRGPESPSRFDEIPEPPAWMGGALCAQTDPEAFFPEKGGSTRDAKRICAQCDVIEECLAWALETDQRFGIWGGKSERERRKLKPTSARAEGMLLSAAEVERRHEGVTRLNAEGLLDIEIAERLDLSPHNVYLIRRELGLPRNRNNLPKVGRTS